MNTCRSKGMSTGSSCRVLMSWKTMGNEVCSKFKDLFQKRDKDGDVTIVCSGEFIKAHKFVLSVGSSYFREVLKSFPSKHPTILLKGISATTMNRLLRCLYLGEVIIHSAFVTDFSFAADELGMFTKDILLMFQEIPGEPQGFEIPQSKFHPKKFESVHAPSDSGSFSSVKIKKLHGFQKQKVSPNTNPCEQSYSFHHDNSAALETPVEESTGEIHFRVIKNFLTSGGSVTVKYGKKTD